MNSPKYDEIVEELKVTNTQGTAHKLTRRRRKGEPSACCVPQRVCHGSPTLARCRP